MININILTSYLKKCHRTYTIQKNNSYFKISKSSHTYFNKSNEKTFNEKFNQYINTFISIMSKNPNIDLKLFYKNLKDLIIKEKNSFNKLLFIKSYTKGQYNGYDNKIVVLKEDNFYSIYHELLHCASRRIVNEEMNVGFDKFAMDEKSGKITFNMGKALNEGYTTLLEKRYFLSIEHTQKRGYVIEEFISSMLEKIVGKDKMEALYFNADLEGLISELKNYSNEEDIYTFLKYFDKVFVNAKKKVKAKEAEYIYKFIGGFLLKLYAYKLLENFDKYIINRDEFIDLLDEFIRTLSINHVQDKKNNYYFLTNDFTDQILDQISESIDDKQKK